MAVRDPERQCRGKRKYDTKKLAREGLADARKRVQSDPHRLVIYMCPHCGFYHVGHKPTE